MFGLNQLIRAIGDFAFELQSFTAWLRGVRQDAEADYAAARQSQEGEGVKAEDAATNGHSKTKSRQRA